MLTCPAPLGRPAALGLRGRKSKAVASLVWPTNIDLFEQAGVVPPDHDRPGAGVNLAPTPRGGGGRGRGGGRRGGSVSIPLQWADHDSPLLIIAFELLHADGLARPAGPSGGGEGESREGRTTARPKHEMETTVYAMVVAFVAALVLKPPCRGGNKLTPRALSRGALDRSRCAEKWMKWVPGEPPWRNNDMTPTVLHSTKNTMVQHSGS